VRAARVADPRRHDVAGTQVGVFGVAKTLADCFKFRNKVGLDFALEALQEAWNGKRATMDELWRYAEICRVANVMRPYLKAIRAAWKRRMGPHPLIPRLP